MRLFLIAGEPSGDALGAALLAGLRAEGATPEIAGVGGPLMEAEGLRSQFDMADLTVMGLAEVLPRLPRLVRRIRETARAVEAFRPDALITIDAPDFCLRVARRAKRRLPGLRTVHYVAPSVWAWRPGRAAKMAKVIDHVLALLPFEPPYMEAAGMGCDFVGHPLVAEPVATEAEIAAVRAKLGVGDDKSLVPVLPGSRSGEIRHIGRIFGEVVSQVDAPDIAWVLPVAPGRAEAVRTAIGRWRVQPTLIEPNVAEKRAIFAASHAALAKSGTVTLELAAAGCPMVVAYDANPVTRAIVERMVKVEAATLVNLVTGRRDIPEFIGSECRPGAIAEELRALLDDSALRDQQEAAFDEALEALGRGGHPPGRRAARAVLNAMG